MSAFNRLGACEILMLDGELEDVSVTSQLDKSDECFPIAASHISSALGYISDVYACGDANLIFGHLHSAIRNINFTSLTESMNESLDLIADFCEPEADKVIAIAGQGFKFRSLALDITHEAFMETGSRHFCEIGEDDEDPLWL